MLLNHHLENSGPLQIRTNTLIGSTEEVHAVFFTAGGEEAGGVFFRFSSPPKYFLGWCTTWKSFPTSLPSETDKVWTVFYLGTSSERQVVIHCNEKEVLNAVISASTCTSNSPWSNYWSRDVQRIMFPSDSTNTASDYYREGNYLKFLLMLT